jgi:AcrR family transcriptional regulator
MPVPRRRLTPEARAREILLAAEQLLRQDGLKVRVEDVTAAAGASKGTFFVCYPTWNDLLLKIRDRMVERYLAMTASVLPQPGGPADWNAVLTNFSTALIDFSFELGGLHEVLFHGPFALDCPPPPGNKPTVVIADILRAGLQAGDFAAIDPEPTAELIFAVIHAASDAIRDGGDRARQLAALHDMLRRSVRPLCDQHHPQTREPA